MFKATMKFVGLMLLLIEGITGVLGADWMPKNNVEIISGTAVGGAQDKTARIIAKILQMNQLANVSTTVINKPGGSGVISLNYLNQHMGDGHYILISSSTLISSQLLGKSRLGYSDVTPISHLYREHTSLAVHPDSPLKSGIDLIDALKKNPQSISIGLASLGSEHHIAMALAAQSAGISLLKLKFVVFPSGSQAITALLGRHIDAVSIALSNVIPHMKAGRMRALAVAATKRVDGDAATIPTWKEQGISSEATNIRGIVGPPRMSKDSIRFWESTFNNLAMSKEWKAELQKQHWEDAFMSSENTKKSLETQHERLRSLFTELALIK